MAALDKALSVLPRFILRRHYTQQRLENEVLIDTRTANPIDFSLGSSVPTVHAWFTITNFTTLRWRLRDFSAEIWIGQPIAAVTCQDRPEIQRRRLIPIFAESFLNELQVKRLNELKERRAKEYSDNVSIYVNAHLESKVGLINLKPLIENRPVSIR